MIGGCTLTAQIKTDVCDIISLSKSSAGGFVFLVKYPLISNHLGDFDTHLESEIDGFLFGDNMKEIQMLHGVVVKVDDEDYELVSKYTWHLAAGYAQTTTRNGKRRKSTYMHRMILNPKEGQFVDHKNGDRLDNRRENIRICTIQENQRNQKKDRANNKSGFRGVSFYKRYSNWRAIIDDVFLGYFKTPEEAAKAYDKASKERHGEFGIRNLDT